MLRLQAKPQASRDPVRFLGICGDSASAEREAIILTNGGYRCAVHHRVVAIGAARADVHIIVVRGGP